MPILRKLFGEAGLNNRREKEMEFKMKEKVMFNSFTFKKRVIEETIELLRNRNNYIVNDIYFTTMICFLNNMVEENLILNALASEDGLEEKMTEIVEPMYLEYVVKNEEAKDSFEDIVYQIIDFMDREYTIQQSGAGMLSKIMDTLGSLTMEDITKIIMQLAPLLKQINPKVEKTNEEIKQEAKQDIENLKMKALIEKFQRENK